MNTYALLRSAHWATSAWRELLTAFAAAIGVLLIMVLMATWAEQSPAAHQMYTRALPTISYVIPGSINTLANAVSQGRAVGTQDPLTHDVYVTYTLEPGLLASVTHQMQEACTQMQAAIWNQWNGTAPLVVVRFWIADAAGQWGGRCSMTPAEAAPLTDAHLWEDITAVWLGAEGIVTYVPEGT